MVDTGGYYHAAYAAAALIYAAYAASVWWRARAVRARLAHERTASARDDAPRPA